jgi:hypothetical protein
MLIENISLLVNLKTFVTRYNRRASPLEHRAITVEYRQLSNEYLNLSNTNVLSTIMIFSACQAATRVVKDGFAWVEFAL